MALTLHYHPLSSYCWKALIALYENGTPFVARMANPGDAADRANLAALWPTGKIPLLEDDGQVVPETSIMIEYLDRRHPGRHRLLPATPDAQIETRLWDRLFDLYVMNPMQRYIAQLLRPEPARDAAALAAALAELDMAYGMVERGIVDRPWAAGSDFSLADCAAAPALFYAAIVQPFPAGHTSLAAYFERLIARPSVQRVIAEARPYFRFFPLQHAMPARFRPDGDAHR